MLIAVDAAWYPYYIGMIDICWSRLSHGSQIRWSRPKTVLNLNSYGWRFYQRRRNVNDTDWPYFQILIPHKDITNWHRIFEGTILTNYTQNMKNQTLTFLHCSCSGFWNWYGMMIWPFQNSSNFQLETLFSLFQQPSVLVRNPKYIRWKWRNQTLW